MKSTKNKTQRPKEIHNHPRNIDTIKSHTLIEMKVFNDLSMAGEDVEETFLATFLICQLCKFVFPREGVNLICPGVFKGASRMAQGETFSLVILVLANIYV